VENVYKRLIVARYSPGNRCYVKDGDVLIVRPLRRRLELGEPKAHKFVAASDPTETAQFGWTKDVPPFSLEQFIKEHLKNIELDELSRSHLTAMLDAASRVPAGTPMGVMYQPRGVENRRMELDVYRVFFYPEKDKGQV
jgi:hypothetical protein